MTTSPDAGRGRGRALTRRTALGIPLLAGLAPVLAACGDGGLWTSNGDPVTADDQSGADGPERLAYGDDPSQYGELTLPEGTPRGVVVVIHGGFWKAEFDASLGQPLAASLAAQGWAAWNLEYRRVGDGGGAPATFDDVAAGIDHLAELDLDLTRVVTLGHSAGGHLAAWAASRLRFEEWAGGVPVTHVVSQAGVLDLRAGDAEGLGGGAVAALLGRAPTDEDDRYDPARQVPLEVPVWCVHGGDDTIVPPSQSADYVEAATEAGATAELVEVEGDHFVVIDVDSEAWQRQLAVLDQIG